MMETLNSVNENKRNDIYYGAKKTKKKSFIKIVNTITDDEMFDFILWKFENYQIDVEFNDDEINKLIQEWQNETRI